MPERRHIRLATLLVAVVLTVLLPALGFGVGTIWYAVSAERSAADKRLLEAARDITVALDRQLTGYLDAVITYATSPAFGPDPSAPDIPALYTQARIVGEKLDAAISVVRPDGTRLFHTSRPLGASLPSVQALQLIQRVAATGSPGVGDVVLGTVSGQYSVAIAAPIIDKDHHVVLVAVLSMRAEILRRLLQSTAASSTGFSSISDGNGVFVARSDDLHTGAIGQPIALATWEHLLEHDNGLFSTTGRNGVLNRYAFQRLQVAAGWRVFVAQPAAVLAKSWHRPLLLFGGAGMLTLMLAFLLALLATRQIVRPLQQLADYARSVTLARATGHPGGATVLALGPVREIEVLRQGLVAVEESFRQQAEAERAVATARAERDAELRALFEASPIGLGRTRASGEIIEANDVLLSILNVRRTELEARKLRWTDLTPPGRQGALDLAMQQAMTAVDGRCMPVEHELLRPDNSRVPVLINFTRLTPGVPEAAFFVVDLTQTRHTEHQLRDLLATVDMGSFMTRDMDGAIRYWSGGSEKLYGWTAAEAAGRNAHAMLQTVSAVPLKAIEAELAEFGRWSGDLRHRTRDGRQITVTAQKLLRRNAQGQTIIVELMTDVTAQRHAETALAESEARLRAIGEASPDPIYSKDREGRILYANPAAIRLMDGAELDPVGETSGDPRQADDTARRRLQNDHMVEASGQPATFEEIAAGRDGVIRLFLSTKAPLRDPATGAVTGIAVISRDVTAQRAHDVVAARLATIVTALPDAVVSFAADGRIQSWNRGAEVLFGWTEAEAVGAPVNLLVPDRLADQDPTGVFASAMRGEVIRDHETLRRTKTGQEIPVAITAARMIASDGTVIGVSAIFRDLRPRNAVQATLRESEARWRNLAESLPGFVFVADAEGHNIYTSSQMQAFAGLPAEALLKDGWLDIVHPDDVARAAGTWAKAVRTGDAYQAEYRFRAVNGQYAWYLCRSLPQHDDGRIVRWNGACIDITDTVAARELATRTAADLERVVDARTRELEMTQARLAHAAKLEALGRLAGGIAHDFNNVLQAVQGGVALAIRRLHSHPDKVGTYLNIANAAAERGSAVTGRLLTFARRGELLAQAIAAGPLLEGLAQMLEHTLGPSVCVQVEAPAGLPDMLADKAQLETVLVNLANNSRDAMPQGIGTIRLTAQVAAPAPPLLSTGSFVRLAVVDDGAGMAPDILARVSEPFFTTKQRGAGTGLGLAMARGFAEQSGGALSVESAPGRGTTVFLWLPVAGEPRLPILAESPAPSAADRLAHHVLVVDDETIVRTVVATTLADHGHEVTEAADAAAALTMLENGLTVDVLVTDLAMPGAMDGLGLIKAARQRRPGLPAALLTGHTGDAGTKALQEVAGSGPFVMLHKPVSADVLESKIDVLLYG